MSKDKKQPAPKPAADQKPQLAEEGLELVDGKLVVKAPPEEPKAEGIA